MRRKETIADADSPDHSICAHCGVSISWDEYSYTHDTNGFSTCGTVVRGGSSPGMFERLLGIPRSAKIDPEIVEDPAYEGKNAEPVEWYE